MWLSLAGKWCRSNLAVIIGRSRPLSPRVCRVPNEPTRSEAVTLENLSSSLMLRRRVCNVCLGCRVTSLPNECAVAPIAARIICAPNSIPSVQCAPHNQLTGYIHRNARSRSAVRIAGFAAHTLNTSEDFYRSQNGKNRQWNMFVTVNSDAASDLQSGNNNNTINVRTSDGSAVMITLILKYSRLCPHVRIGWNFCVRVVSFWHIKSNGKYSLENTYSCKRCLWYYFPLSFASRSYA